MAQGLDPLYHPRKVVPVSLQRTICLTGMQGSQAVFSRKNNCSLFRGLGLGNNPMTGDELFP